MSDSLLIAEITKLREVNRELVEAAKTVLGGMCGKTFIGETELIEAIRKASAL